MPETISCRDLRDTIVNQDGDPRNVVKNVILAVTFCGGTHCMFLKGNKMPWLMLENLPIRFIHNSDNKPQVAWDFGEFDSRTAAP